MDDRRHAGVEGDTVVLNMAIASSHASIYRECVEKAGQSGIEVPSYTWFLLQFLALFPYSCKHAPLHGKVQSEAHDSSQTVSQK